MDSRGHIAMVGDNGEASRRAASCFQILSSYFCFLILCPKIYQNSKAYITIISLCNEIVMNLKISLKWICQKYLDLPMACIHIYSYSVHVTFRKESDFGLWITETIPCWDHVIAIAKFLGRKEEVGDSVNISLRDRSNSLL